MDVLIRDLLSKGMNHASDVILTGCSGQLSEAAGDNTCMLEAEKGPTYIIEPLTMGKGHRMLDLSTRDTASSTKIILLYTFPTVGTSEKRTISVQVKHQLIYIVP